MKLFIAIFLSSLITLPALANENKPIIEIVKHPSKTWHFSGVRGYESDNGFRVRGYITAEHTFGLPQGYVDIAAYSSDGELVAQTTAKYFPKFLIYRARLKGKVRFFSDLTTELPPNSTIKVAFHSFNQF